MRTLVSDIIDSVASLAGDSGICASTPEGRALVVRDINLACKALHTRIDDSGGLYYWHVPVWDGCFALPEDCLEGRQFFVNGFSAVQHDQWYQGKVCWGLRDQGECCYGPQIIDMGDFTIPLPLHNLAGLRFGLVAQSDADAGKVVNFEYVNEYGENRRESLTLLAQQQVAISEGTVRDITLLVKPQTQDNVKAYEVLPTPQNQRFFICDYGPKVQIGAFRRKKLHSCFNRCQLVQIKGKRRYFKITSEDDICPFDNELAIGFGLKAIAAWRRDDMGVYQANLASALNEIQRQMQDADSAGNVAVAKWKSGFGCNPSQAGNNPLVGTSATGFYGYGGYG